MLSTPGRQEGPCWGLLKVLSSSFPSGIALGGSFFVPFLGLALTEGGQMQSIHEQWMYFMHRLVLGVAGTPSHAALDSQVASQKP